MTHIRTFQDTLTAPESGRSFTASREARFRRFPWPCSPAIRISLWLDYAADDHGRSLDDGQPKSLTTG